MPAALSASAGMLAARRGRVCSRKCRSWTVRRLSSARRTGSRSVREVPSFRAPGLRPMDTLPTPPAKTEESRFSRGVSSMTVAVDVVDELHDRWQFGWSGTGRRRRPMPAHKVPRRPPGAGRPPSWNATAARSGRAARRARETVSSSRDAGPRHPAGAMKLTSRSRSFGAVKLVSSHRGHGGPRSLGPPPRPGEQQQGHGWQEIPRTMMSYEDGARRVGPSPVDPRPHQAAPLAHDEDWGNRSGDRRRPPGTTAKRSR